MGLRIPSETNLHFPCFQPPSPPAPSLPQLTLSMGLVKPPQLAGKEVRDREAASRTRGRVPHTALPALQDPNPVPCRQHTSPIELVKLLSVGPGIPITCIPITCNGLIEAPLAPGPFLLLFLPLLLLGPLTASPAALHLGQALLQGLL